MSVTRNYSGVVYELVKGVDDDGNDTISQAEEIVVRYRNGGIWQTYLVLDAPSPDWVYQEFTLPDDYQRGGVMTPPLAAIQVLCAVESNFAKTAALDYKLEHYTNGGWTSLTTGTVIGAHSVGDEVWFDLYFDAPVAIDAAWLKDSFRFAVKGRQTPPEPLRDLVVIYDAIHGRVTIQGVGYPMRIEPNEFRTLTVGGYPAFLWRDPDSDQVLCSHQCGVRWLWYAVRPPSWAKCYDASNTQFQHNGVDTAFKFRILAGVADTGHDVVGNPQRQTVHYNSADNLDTFTNATVNDFWLSKPNPSEFAVESLYFDMSTADGGAQVIDNVLVDPITPGVYFHIYFSNDGDPGTTELDWERKLWTPVTKTYQMNRREVHALPNPVTARYFKVEFTYLRAEKYDPGDFQTPILFKKHPKWVINYFFARLNEVQTSEDPLVASRVRVNYNALDLAYNYYLDDLGQEPDTPVHLDQATNTNFLSQFLTDQSDSSDRVDPVTLGKINIAFQPFQQVPGTHSTIQSVLKLYNNAGTNYPIETTVDPSSPNQDVSSLRREALVFESQMPVMFFYVTARHLYRLSQAELNYGRAYFAGVRQLAFTRSSYTARADDKLYLEGVGDNVNVEMNDFVSDPVTFDWVTNT